MANGIGINKGVENWQFQSSYVEREMDNAAYSAAHPDDTIVLAGPPRKGSILDSGGKATKSPGSLLAIGMLQSIQFTQTKPTQPMMSIGSGRSFFVSGKAQTQWTIARLFVNGRNLLRVLYHNAVNGSSGLDVSQFDDPAAKTANSNFFINLDSELYYVPFGLACFFRNKTRDLVGSFYAELAMINSYAVQANAGQNMILENVSGLADRLLPLEMVEIAGAPTSTSVPRATVDALLDFTGTSEALTPDAPQVIMDDILP
jgi:hypothetical protein